MRNGGNINLKNFFSRYKIAPDAPIDFKFKTKAAQYYREKVYLFLFFFNSNPQNFFFIKIAQIYCGRGRIP